MEFTLEELCEKLDWDTDLNCFKNLDVRGIAVNENDPDYVDEILETHGKLKVIDFRVNGNILFVKLEKPKEDVWDFED